MKKMNENVWWYVAAVIFYLTTMIGYFTEGSFDGLLFCLGSAALCIACASDSKKERETE